MAVVGTRPDAPVSTEDRNIPGLAGDVPVRSTGRRPESSSRFVCLFVCLSLFRLVCLFVGGSFELCSWAADTTVLTWAGTAPLLDHFHAMALGFPHTCGRK